MYNISDAIGIILATDKNNTVVEFTLPTNNENIYASTYKLTLPSKEELINFIEDEKVNIFLNK